MSSGDSHGKNAVLEEMGDVRVRGVLDMKECSRRRESFGISEETTGFPAENGPNGHMPGAAVERPPLPVWVSDALLANTVEVWSEEYGRAISEEEALEILTNVKRLGEALLKAKREMRR